MINIRRNSRISEVLAFVIFLLGILNSTTLVEGSTLYILRDKLQIFKDRLQKAYEKTKTLSDLEDKDLIRDNSFSCMMKMVNAFLLHSNSTLRQAAKTLAPVLLKYDLVDITRGSYSQQTGKSNKIIIDLEKQVMQDAMTVIPPVLEEYEFFKNAELNFEESHLQYHNIHSAETDLITATEMKNEGFELTKQILDFLDIMKTIEPDTYQPICSSVEEVVEDNNNVVDARMKKQKEEQEETQE